MDFQNELLFADSMNQAGLFSYIGQATDISQAPQQFHLHGCPNAAFPLAECFQCSTIDLRLLSPSPPPQQRRQSHYVQERSPSPRTWAQVVAQGGNPSMVPLPVTPPRLPQPQNDPALPLQVRQHECAQQNISSAVPVPQGVQRATGYVTYAEAAQPRVEQMHQIPHRVIYPHAEGNRRALQAAQSSRHDASASIGAFRNRYPPHHHDPSLWQNPSWSPYSGSPAQHHQLPQNPNQTFLETPMQNLNSMIRQGYTNDPRSVEGLVNGTERGGHRRSVHDNGALASSTIPMSPGATSTTSSFSQRRRTGLALRDSDLPFPCQDQHCNVTFAKMEDLR